MCLQSQTDAVLGWVDKSGRHFLMDTWIGGYTSPQLDTSQDIYNKTGKIENGMTILSFVRKRSTSDEQVHSPWLIIYIVLTAERFSWSKTPSFINLFNLFFCLHLTSTMNRSQRSVNSTTFYTFFSQTSSWYGSCQTSSWYGSSHNKSLD